MADWIIFGITAVLVLFMLAAFACAVLGVWRFGFVMNRMHAAGIGDTLGLLCVTAAVALCTGFRLDALKPVLVLVFLWLTSPISTHFLSQVEYYTDEDLEKELDLVKGEGGEK